MKTSVFVLTLDQSGIIKGKPRGRDMQQMISRLKKENRRGRMRKKRTGGEG
jgi:hypothetical protein